MGNEHENRAPPQSGPGIDPEGLKSTALRLSAICPVRIRMLSVLLREGNDTPDRLDEMTHEIYRLSDAAHNLPTLVGALDVANHSMLEALASECALCRSALPKNSGSA